VTALYVALLAVAILESIAFIAVLGPPRRHGDNAGVAWFLSATAWSGLAVDASLLVALLGHHVPGIVAAAVLVVQDVVFGWRLWLAAGVRRQR
jgi:hypothetical protein